VNKEYEKMTKRINRELEALKCRWEFLAGWAEVLTEIKDLKVFEKSGELKDYVEKKTRQFWDESVPITTSMCEKNIELGASYVKSEKVVSDGNDLRDNGYDEYDGVRD